MQLLCEKNRVVIEDEKVLLYREQTKIYEISVKEMLFYSRSYPWEYEACQWVLQQIVEDEDKAKFIYEYMEVQASMVFMIEGKEIRIHVEYKNVGEKKISQFTAGLTLPFNMQDKNKITIPHIIYNDNPSADPERIVPHIGNIPGEGIIVEEHRLPIPAVNVEWKQEGYHSYLTLLSLPKVVSGDEEEYWSLGAIKENKGERIISLSGPLMFNGMKDVVYGGRCTPLSYMKGYRRLQPNESLHKTYYLSWGYTKEGEGFRNIIDVGYSRLEPKTIAQHSFTQIIDYKKNVLDSRFYENDKSIGYLTFGSANGFGNVSKRPEYYLYGWTGQGIKLAWCDCMQGIKSKEKFRLERGMDIVDFFVKNGQSSIDGLYRGYYVIEENCWKGEWKDDLAPLSSRIQGESISDLIDVMYLLRQHEIQVPSEWEVAVENACIFFMDEKRHTKDGLYPLVWELDGSIIHHDINASGMPCVLALTKAGEYFSKQEYIDYAEDMYEKYAKLHMDTFDIPFARATMDAKCEDKEAGLFFFVTAALLYRITGKDKYRNWSDISADWILTFVFFWETGFQPGTICALKEFKTTGWPGVSVQNHHLDVFFPTYELYEYGKLTSNNKYMNMAKHVSNALTYGIATKEGEWGYTIIGEQGEHYYNTNYFQLLYPNVLNYLKNYRGGMQVWNPSWITAQVMSSALKFHYIEEMK